MKEKILVCLETKTIKKLDVARNIIPRSAFIRRLVENELNTVNGTLCQDATVHGAAQNHDQNMCNGAICK
jgi:hypothetical protein